MIVIVYPFGHFQLGIPQRQIGRSADMFLFDTLVKSFDFAIALRIVDRGPDVSEVAGLDEVAEIVADKLSAIIGNDSGTGVGIAFVSALESYLDIEFGHGFAQLEMNDIAAVAVEDADQIIEDRMDSNVRNIYMPMLMRSRRLVEAFVFGRSLCRIPSLKRSRLFEDAIDRGWRYMGDIKVHHHPGQSSVTF